MDKSDLGNIESIEVESNTSELSPVDIMTLIVGAAIMSTLDLKLRVPAALVKRFTDLASGGIGIYKDAETGDLIAELTPNVEVN